MLIGSLGRDVPLSDEAAQRAAATPNTWGNRCRPGLLLGVLLTLASVSLPAAAQSTTLPYSTNGVLIGEGRLHTFFALESRFDSAAGYFSPRTGTGPSELQGELLFSFRPGLRFNLPGELVKFAAGGHLEYVAYSGLVTAGSGAANRLQAGADASLTVNESGAVSVVLSDTFQRDDRTQNLAVGFGVLSLRNVASLQVPIRPGGGALEITPGGTFGIEYLQPLADPAAITDCTDPSCDPNQVEQFNSLRFGGSLDARWSFLPRTALVLNSSFQQTEYPSGATPATSLGTGTLGIAGQLTQRLAIVANAGWSHNFGVLGGGTVVGMAELRYPPTPNLQLAAGYQRRLQPVALYGTARSDRVYARANAKAGQKLVLGLEGGANWLGFEGGVRSDSILSGHATAEYELLAWLLVGGGYRLETRGSTSAVRSLNLTRHEVTATLTARY